MKKGFLVSVFIVLIVNIYKAQVNFTESNLPIFIIETGNKTIVDEPKILMSGFHYNFMLKHIE